MHLDMSASWPGAVGGEGGLWVRVPDVMWSRREGEGDQGSHTNWQLAWWTTFYVDLFTPVLPCGPPVDDAPMTFMACPLK